MADVAVYHSVDSAAARLGLIQPPSLVGDDAHLEHWPLSLWCVVRSAFDAAYFPHVVG